MFFKFTKTTRAIDGEKISSDAFNVHQISSLPCYLFNAAENSNSSATDKQFNRVVCFSRLYFDKSISNESPSGKQRK